MAPPMSGSTLCESKKSLADTRPSDHDIQVFPERVRAGSLVTGILPWSVEQKTTRKFLKILLP
jgi:hypothetical protein